MKPEPVPRERAKSTNGEEIILHGKRMNTFHFYDDKFILMCIIKIYITSP